MYPFNNVVRNILLCGFVTLMLSQYKAFAAQTPAQLLAGNVSGTVVDRTGAVVSGARVKLSQEGNVPELEVLSGDNGQFSFANIVPGPFHLTITARGFAKVESSGILYPGETANLPPAVLEISKLTTDVEVTVPQTELAEEQIKSEEKQRLIGFLPNFNVTYDHKAVPLTTRQKFELAWKTTFDPATFGVTGIIAGVQQWQNNFSGYGQGAEGYAKRYGAAYANFFSGTMLSTAILPSLLKQDPRYFYKGTGTKRSRALYAIANSVIRKGDNGHWQPNYSGIIGGLAAGGISNLYYPSKDRNGLSVTFENALIGIGGDAAGNLFQEFLARKLTPKQPRHASTNP